MSSHHSMSSFIVAQRERRATLAQRISTMCGPTKRCGRKQSYSDYPSAYARHRRRRCGCSLYTRQHTTSMCYSSVSQYINTHSSFIRGSNIYIYIQTQTICTYIYVCICSIAQACGFSMKPLVFMCGPYEMLCVCTLYRMRRHELTSPEIHPCASPSALLTCTPCTANINDYLGPRSTKQQF